MILLYTLSYSISSDFTMMVWKSKWSRKKSIEAIFNQSFWRCMKELLFKVAWNLIFFSITLILIKFVQFEFANDINGDVNEDSDKNRCKVCTINICKRWNSPCIPSVQCIRCKFSQLKNAIRSLWRKISVANTRSTKKNFSRWKKKKKKN